MLNKSQGTDPLTHETAIRIARRLVEMMSGILMRHEQPAALTEAYIVAREELEQYDRERGRKTA